MYRIETKIRTDSAEFKENQATMQNAVATLKDRLETCSDALTILKLRIDGREFILWDAVDVSDRRGERYVRKMLGSSDVAVSVESVLIVVDAVLLLGYGQGFHIGDNPRHLCPQLSVQKIRDGNRREDPDNGHNDEKFNQREAREANPC